MGNNSRCNPVVNCLAFLYRIYLLTSDKKYKPIQHLWIHLLVIFVGLRSKHMTLLHAVRRLWVALRCCYQAWTKTHGQFHKIVPCVCLNGGWSKASVCVCVCVSACADEGFRTYSPSEFTAQVGSGEWSNCFMISDYCPDVDEIFALLGYYAAYSGSYLPTFRSLGTDGLLRNRWGITTKRCVIQQKNESLESCVATLV